MMMLCCLLSITAMQVDGQLNVAITFRPFGAPAAVRDAALDGKIQRRTVTARLPA
jgi:hypothetical protein